MTQEEVILTTATKKIHAQFERWKAFPRDKKKWKIVLEGGAGAGKTFSALLLLMSHAASTPNQRVFIVGAALTKMRTSVVNDFAVLMRAVGYMDEKRWIGAKTGRPSYEFPNGSQIHFFGLQDGMGFGQRGDIVYFNEANFITFSQFRDFAQRIDLSIIDYNPTFKFWVHKKILSGARDTFAFLRLTYKDNEAARPSEVQELEEYKRRGEDPDDPEQAYYANRYRVMGQGFPGTTEGAVFAKAQICQSIPEGAKLVGYGMDFGFSEAEGADPWAAVEVWRLGKAIYINEIAYQVGLSIDDAAKICRERFTNTDGFIVGDGGGGGALVVSELQKKGIRIVKAVKGPGSIEGGIQIMKEYAIFITESSTSLLAEQAAYIMNPKTNKPVDHDNHLWDAARYVMLTDRIGLSGGVGSLSLFEDEQDEYSIFRQ